MRRGRCQIRKAETTKYTKIRVGWGGEEEGLVGGKTGASFGGTNIKKKSGMAKGFSPICGGHGCLEEGAKNVVDSAEGALSFAVLR